MMLMIVVSLFIVTARDLSQCHANPIHYLSHGLSTEGIIRTTMDDLSQSIEDFGLDPLNIGTLRFNYTKPIPLNVTILGVSSNGLSDIVVNKARYSLFSSILSFDIEMPYVNMTIGNSSISVDVLRNPYKLEHSASLEMSRLRVVGQINFSFNLTNGIMVESLDIHFSLGNIKPEVRLIIQDEDYSPIVNSFLLLIPDIIRDSTSMINDFLGKFLLNYVRELMSSVL